MKNLKYFLLPLAGVTILTVYFYKSDKLNANMSNPTNWNKIDLKAQELPKEELAQKSVKVDITTHKIRIQTYEVFYRRATYSNQNPKNLTVLFLHGQSFKSETWLNLKTLHFVAAMGYKVFAVDLPGYGESCKEQVPEANRGEFLHELISILTISPCVIVSPSMSGSFAIPLLKSHPSDFKGYIPVAPVSTGKLTETEYKNIQVPTMIISGDKDKRLGDESIANLKNIPTSQVCILPAAGHAAYLDQPDLFHQLTFNFLNVLDGSNEKV